jgi:hypothetical protein
MDKDVELQQVLYFGCFIYRILTPLLKLKVKCESRQIGIRHL